ncbi:hypothetical protein [Ktedonosporobacter rubrisoli]|uniref:hypothetical protein n=1 Tax=Ktedonosporobacter rubrisoli TaxID=2509675 RepID=UPI001A920D7E|nr:hypothetical protein [Ktedonosporobacter rubrisoli]
MVGGPRHPHPFAPVPLLLLETRPPDGATFNRAEYYQVALKQLGEYPYGPCWEQKKGRGKDAKFNVQHAEQEDRQRFGENESSIPSHTATHCMCEQSPSVDQARGNPDQAVERNVSTRASSALYLPSCLRAISADAMVSISLISPTFGRAPVLFQAQIVGRDAGFFGMKKGCAKAQEECGWGANTAGLSIKGVRHSA